MEEEKEIKVFVVDEYLKTHSYQQFINEFMRKFPTGTVVRYWYKNSEECSRVAVIRKFFETELRIEVINVFNCSHYPSWIENMAGYVFINMDVESIKKYSLFLLDKNIIEAKENIKRNRENIRSYNKIKKLLSMNIDKILEEINVEL